MINDADESWKNAVSAVAGFLNTPHGEIDVLRWLREKETQLDDNTPRNVVAALKAVPINMKFFGPQLRATVTLIAQNVASPKLPHKTGK